MATLHNTASPEDFAKTVLMPGDPLRAKFLADTYLDNVRLVNNVRGIQGYTGEYKGKRVSVMASGMGMPSIGIYSYELYHFFNVENIIRIGSAGMLNPALHIRDVVAAMSAYTNSNYGSQFGFSGTLAPCCTYRLLERAVNAARKLNVQMPVGPVFSSDVFYEEQSSVETMRKLGVLAVEMETYALYLNAARAGKNALTLLTISDNPYTGESVSAAEVRETFTTMMDIALEAAEE